MYRFSMEWFQQIFIECLSDVQLTESSDVKPPLSTLTENLTATVLKRTSSTLSSQHYIPFVFRLCCLLCMNNTSSCCGKPKLSPEEWKTMVKLCSLLGNKPDKLRKTKCKSSNLTDKSKPSFIAQRLWDTVCFLEKQLPCFTGLQDHISIHLDMWLNFQYCPNPIASLQNIPRHNKFAPSTLSTFQQLLLVQVLCVSRFYQEVGRFISLVLDEQCHEMPLVSLPEVLSTTKHWTPTLLLLSGSK